MFCDYVIILHMYSIIHFIKTNYFFHAFILVSDSSSQIEMEVSVPLGKEEPDPELILQSDKLKQDLAVMERVVLENIFQTKLAAYRQLPVLEGNAFYILYLKYENRS